MIVTVLAIVAVTSGISGLASYCLARFGKGSRLRRAVLAGLLPTILIVTALVIGHIMWLEQRGSPHHEAYSPLMFLLYGFWMLPIILVPNFAVSSWVGRVR